ncbi:YqgE/AlgH family protein [Silanimonas sp.]|jgi:putative transcriptional regulator|uniref:YqgE/AlgH family protein n=1 Tax=Silanimonas sp. TaxID=1929290 RepID=UPI0022C30591|nr:YqgE/AlgH family protein [Silanimonas sp.]MCZ8167039.1 YqgE/AlgH family protein [Silanimonas sp.]
MPLENTLASSLLLAMPGMDDPNFARSAVLVCQHDGDGAMGVVLNRRTDVLLGELFEQLGIEGASHEMMGRQVLWGGPVQVDRGFVLHDDPRPWPSTLRFGGFSLTSSREILHAMARGDGPERYLVMVGHAGWGGEQLEGELAQNAWLTVPAPEAMVFDTDSEQLWQVAAGQIGVDMANMADYSGHA